MKSCDLPGGKKWKPTAYCNIDKVDCRSPESKLSIYKYIAEEKSIDSECIKLVTQQLHVRKNHPLMVSETVIYELKKEC